MHVLERERTARGTLGRSLLRWLPGGSLKEPFQSYALERFLSGGDSGEVWSANDRRSGGVCAVKLIRPSHRVARGEHPQAQVMRAVAHPNVVRLLDAGPDYLVMEYLPDCLEAVLRPGVTLPLAEAIRIAADVARAVEHIHSKGYIHMDVHPGNVLLSPEGAKLGDFEMAADPAYYAARPKPDLAAMGVASPEELAEMFPDWPREFGLEGGAATPAVDVYGIGQLLHWMTTGEACGPDGFAKTDDVDLNRLLFRVLSPEPEDRPTVAELRAALHRLSSAQRAVLARL